MITQVLYILSKSIVGLYFLLRILDVERTYSQHKNNQIKYPKAYLITKYLIYLLSYNLLIEYLFKVIL